jgi:hypothetical protein
MESSHFSLDRRCRAHVSLCRGNRRWAAGEDASGTLPQVVFEATVLAQARGADLQDRLSSLAIERMLCLSTRLFLRISLKSLTVNILCTHLSLRNNPSKAKW